MPRRARLTLPNLPLHIIQRGNNRQACFFAGEDYQGYLRWLGEYARQAGCRVHAYALMTNPVHLLLSADRADAAGQLMKALGQRYVQYVNRTYQRSGTLWEGRFRFQVQTGCRSNIAVKRGAPRQRCLPTKIRQRNF